MISLADAYIAKAGFHLSRKAVARPAVLRALALLVAAAGATCMVACVKSGWAGQGAGFTGNGSQFLTAWGGFAILLGGVAAALPAAWRRAGEWLLVVMAAPAVILASGFILANKGTPLGAKLLMLAMVTSASVMARAFAALASGHLELFAHAAGKLAKGVCVGLELLLLVLIIRQFNLVDQMFCHQFIYVIFYGFIFHYFLPPEFRLPFFLFLSLAAVYAVFGFQDSLWLAGMGLALIGICHLPVPFYFRVVFLLLAGGLLAACRADVLHPPWSAAIWPIFGSMFMFRLIAYMYALKYHKGRVSAWHALSYFFLLPNIVFPLFPVVDYTTFCKTSRNDERHRVYQTGVNWIFRGVVQLVLYRYIYYHMVIAPEQVDSGPALLRYMLSNFLLILRLSGQFHLAVGILHLFGFDLPETMHRFLLASSFTDFWRRANIYWKDFMQRVFFYPLFFRLRKLPSAAALAISTLFVFLLTWFFHGYQWFWVRGDFPVSLPDVLFWGIFGSLVLANTLHEAKHGRKRESAGRAWTWAGTFRLGLRIAGTFAVVCVIWSVWISSSVSEWLSLWPAARLTWRDAAWFPALFLAAAAALGVAGRLDALRTASLAKQSVTSYSFFREAAAAGALAALFFAAGQPALYSHLNITLRDTIHDLRTDRLNTRDVALMHKGYYENLIRVERFNSQLWEVYSLRKDDKTLIENTDAGIATHDFLMIELRPWSAIMFRGAPFHTNRWGMRDKDYEKNPPSGTCRIALVGASIPMGSGVGDGESFESLLEDRLNRENDGKAVSNYEILNFSVGRYYAIQRLMVFERKALDFRPEIAFYVAHPTDRTLVIKNMAQLMTQGIPVPYEGLLQIAREAGVENETRNVVAESRLQNYGNETLAFIYHRFVQDCRENGILPVFVFVPVVGNDFDPREAVEDLRIAKEQGFIVLDLTDAFDGVKEEDIRLSDWNSHPNARGHALIATRLYEEILKNKTLRDKMKLAPGT